MDPGPHLRKACLFVLQAWGPEAEPMVPTLLSVSANGADQAERMMALNAAALACPGSPEVREALGRLLHGEAAERSAAAGVVYAARVRDTNFVTPLLLAAQNLRPGQPLSRQPIRELLALSLQNYSPSNVSEIVVNAWEDRDLRGPILVSLLEWGPAVAGAVPVLRTTLQEADSRAFWPETLHVLALMGTAGEPATTAVGRLIDNRDPLIRCMAAYAAARIRNHPEFAVNVLMEQLGNTNYTYARAVMPLRLSENLGLGHREAAAWFLGELGQDARAAAPALRNMLDLKDLRLSLFAARALWRCEGNAQPVLPVLRRALESGNTSSIVLACNVLSEMGSAAVPLEAAVETAMTADLKARAAGWSILRDLRKEP
jgi:hypothetical protein